jgi:uncharacterized Zn-finger protein
LAVFEIVASFVLKLLVSGGGYAPVVCRECNKIYKNFHTLRMHLRQDCGKGKQFKCPECARTFKRNAHVKNHLARIHSELL